MLGAFVGDIVGSCYEFQNTKDYDFNLISSSSDFTDDSVMSMAVALWLMNDREHTHQGLEDMMVQMADTYPHPKGDYGSEFFFWLFHPGEMLLYERKRNVAQKLLCRLKSLVGFAEKPPYVSSTGRHPYGSYGNGSAMRVSAVGWFFDTLEETETVAKISAEITHNHPEGLKGAQAVASAIWMARNGKSKKEIKEYIKTKYRYDLNCTWNCLNRTYSWDSSCQGTVPEALVCFLESTDFEDAIRKAVSIGGDSDTIACIVGSIAEAFYGGVPKEIADKVSDKLPREAFDILSWMRRNTFYKVNFGPDLV